MSDSEKKALSKEELLAKWGKPVKVLDHGHVALIDVMGDDYRVEAAARLSYQQGTRKHSETRGLLRYMLRHKHWSPFEKCVIELDMKMPIFVARQFVRHRTQAINELSGRYSELPEEFYVPDEAQICYQDKKNKQGRAEPLPVVEARQLQDQLRGGGFEAFADYRQYLEAGVARETARIVLPLSTYTQWNSTMNLRNLFNFLGLRLDEHAQWEARQYANVIWEIVQDWVPLAAEAFRDFELEAQTFSRQEMDILRVMLRDWKEYVEAHAEGENLKPDEYVGSTIGRFVGNLPKRERDDFIKKLGLPS